MDEASGEHGRVAPNTGHLYHGARITTCPKCGGEKWAYIGGDLPEEPPCYACAKAATSGGDDA